MLSGGKEKLPLFSCSSLLTFPDYATIGGFVLSEDESFSELL